MLVISPLVVGCGVEKHGWHFKIGPTYRVTAQTFYGKKKILVEIEHQERVLAAAYE